MTRAGAPLNFQHWVARGRSLITVMVAGLIAVVALIEQMNRNISSWIPLVPIGCAIVSLLLCIRFPASAGSMTLLVVAIIRISDAGNQFGFVTFAAIFVVGDWLVRYRLRIGFVALVAFCVIEIVAAPDVGTGLVSVAISAPLCVGVALGYRFYGKVLEAREQELELEKLRSQEAADRVRREIVRTLHDTVATDIAQVIVGSQVLSGMTTGGQMKAQSAAVLESARRAMVSLRGLMNGVVGDVSSPSGRVELEPLLSQCRQMLQARRIDLLVDAETEEWQSLTKAHQKLLALVVREGSVNILKYGAPRTSANLIIEVGEDRIGLTFTNTVNSSVVRPDRGLQGGYGLPALTQRVEREGGIAFFGPSGVRWVLAIDLPRKRSQPMQELDAVMSETAEQETQ